MQLFFQGYSNIQNHYCFALKCLSCYRNKCRQNPLLSTSVFAVSPSIASCPIQTQSTTSWTNLQWHTPSINANKMFSQLFPFASLTPRKIINEQLWHAMVFLEVENIKIYVLVLDWTNKNCCERFKGPLLCTCLHVMQHHCNKARSRCTRLSSPVMVLCRQESTCISGLF